MNTENLKSQTEESLEEAHPSRHIRSYVLRQGRLSSAQERYLDTMMQQIGVPYSETVLDLPALFKREAKHVVEIGFGMGVATAEIASAQPDQDYIGIEVHTPGVGSLCKLIAEKGINNLKIIQHDAVEVFNNMLAPSSLDGIHIFFPDPWPKKRHHKRRLIQPAFVALLVSRLKVGGYIHCATDWQEYAEQMLEVLSNESLLKNTAQDYAPKPEYRPLTKFEQRGIRLGHGVWDLVFKRI